MSWRDQYDAMTLGGATKLLSNPSWACACCGPPIPSPHGTPCFCRLAFGQAEQLHRAAHIVARLIDDASRRKP